jgi:hypothetical protein
METKEKQVGKFFILSKELGRGAFAVCKKGCEVNNIFNNVILKYQNTKRI